MPWSDASSIWWRAPRSGASFPTSGGFGGLFRPDLSGMSEPVLVSSTDGVGTKLKLAFTFKKHDSVGIDLVAMSVNDILVQGATPLFFLDYFATGKLDVDTAETVVSGVAEGCRPGRLRPAGRRNPPKCPTCTRPVNTIWPVSAWAWWTTPNSLTVRAFQVGDVIVGVASSGLHSNGFSLAQQGSGRSGLKADDAFPARTAPACATSADAHHHLCGGRALPVARHERQGHGPSHRRRFLRQYSARAALPGGSPDQFRQLAAARPVFHWLKNADELSWPEILQIFNGGIGYVLILPAEQARKPSTASRPSICGPGASARSLGAPRTANRLWSIFRAGYLSKLTCSGVCGSGRPRRAPLKL